MPHLSVEKLTFGMIVESDVKDRSGRLLLRAGSEINERVLRVLRSWGILEVEVASEGGADEEPMTTITISPEMEAAAREEVDKMFMHVDRTHPAARVLAEVVTARVAGDMARGNRSGG